MKKSLRQKSFILDFRFQRFDEINITGPDDSITLDLRHGGNVMVEDIVQKQRDSTENAR